MKIQRIRLGKVRIPLKKPFKTALREVFFAEDIIVQVVADTGEVGFGNAPPTLVITGDGQQSVAAAIREVLAPKLVGMDVDNLEGIMTTIQGALHHNYSAKAAMDIAIHDLFCKRYGMPLHRFLGGYRQSLQTDLTISVNAPEEMVEDSLAAVAAGYRELKIKVGTDAALDLKRVQAIRQAVGNEIRLRLDANQGWKAKEAVRIIRIFEDKGLDIELIEQPVAAHDFAGLKYVTENVETNIMADEAAFGPVEVFQLLSMRACDLISIKLMKAGGIYNAVKILNLAETMGVECMMSCMLESNVGITAAASLAAARKNITRADLDAAVLLAEEPVAGGVSYAGNQILLSEVPGLGITEVVGWEEI